MWHPDLGWGAVTETRFSSDRWYAERKADAEVAFANVMVSTLLLARQPDPPHAKPNFPTVTHPTPGMPQKTAGFRGQCRFVVLKITALSEDIWH